ITALGFSRDGTRLVTASGDRTARIWEPAAWDRQAGEGAPPASWLPQMTLVGHKAMLTTVAFSPDGSLVLTGGYDRDLRIWDARTGECLVGHVGHRGVINVARFAGRGFLVASAGGDGTARFWTTGNVEAARRLLVRRDCALDGSAGMDAKHETSGDGNWPGASPRGHDSALLDVAFRP